MSKNEFSFDRGHKKWSSLMLPEHKEQLVDWRLDLNRVKRPILASDQREELDRSLSRYYYLKCYVEVSCFSKGHVVKHTGTINRLCMEQRYIVIHMAGVLRTIPVIEIIEIIEVIRLD